MKELMKVFYERSKIFLFAFIATALGVITFQTEKVMASENESGYKQPVFEKVDNLKDYLQQEENNDGYRNFETQYYADPYWSRYGARTHYNKLNSAEKRLYDGLYGKCEEVLNSTKNCDITGNSYTVGLVTYDGTSISENRAKDIAVIFTIDNPQFFFLNNVFTYGNYNGNTKVITPNVYSDFANGQNRNNAKQAFKAQLDNWYSIANSYPTKLQKLRKLEVLIDESVTYVNTQKDQSAYSAVVEKRSVCSGYSKAYEMLSNAMGIEAACLTSETHQWVTINLREVWYDVDVTWEDDDVNDGVSNSIKYFLRPPFGDREHIVQSLWNGLEPRRTAPTPLWMRIFNSMFYYNRYSDVASVIGNNEAKLFDHFMQFGMNEQRIGESSFNCKIYMQNYPDLRNAFGNNYPLYYEHFLFYGVMEGRNAISLLPRNKITSYGGTNYSAVYDPDYYANNNPDLKKAFGNNDELLIKHFVEFGMREGRYSKQSFNVYSYKNEYPDLRRAFGSNLEKYYRHYIENGERENRHTSGMENKIVGAMTVLDGRNYAVLYDANEYVNKYGDLKKAFGYDEEALLRHFVDYGMKEGRQAKTSFNLEIYKSNYADLRKAFGNNNKEYYIHYINYGVNEKRNAQSKI
ncbi:transglutaminase domain-containing protein [Lachnobacterium bovis]|uniref:Transglutaminase-like domain-containing protein n=1 Tax=Lachnobacterium bovis TaxID=140626 RepID=A0A1H9NZS8_9FIRM|nr:transglutaminase domain-containing protein [Lachnobacterium bovis]SER41079.1 hypothetical protein SAMN02910429_00012 [Lachnobacterium bovis]